MTDRTEAEKIMQNSLEQYWEAQSLMEREGYTIKTSTTTKLHPAVGLQKTAFDTFCRLFKILWPAEETPTLDDLTAWRNK